MTAPTATPPKKSAADEAVDAASLSPAQARAAAASAEARAAEARKVADETKRVAKDARARAVKADAEVAKLKLAADPEKHERSNLTTLQAKARLMDAAKAIHPVDDARDAMSGHPWTTVGIAAGVGAVLGASGGVVGHAIGGGAKIVAGLLAIARPAAGAFGKLAAAHFAVQQTAKAQTDAKADGHVEAAVAGAAPASPYVRPSTAPAPTAPVTGEPVQTGF